MSDATAIDRLVQLTDQLVTEPPADLINAARGEASRLGASRRSAAQRRIAIAAAVALAAFVALTPPGRALAGNIADLFGIGSAPLVSHEDGGGSHEVSHGTEVVVGSGTTPSGERVEITAFQGGPSTADRERFERNFGDNLPPEAETDPLMQAIQSGNGGTCFVLDFPDSPEPFGDSSCSIGGFNVPVGSPGFNEARHAHPNSRVAAESMTGPTVTSVEVTYADADGKRVEAPVIFGYLSDELAARIGAPHAMGMYVAYLPADRFPSHNAAAIGTLEITGYDAAGDVVKRVDYGPIYEKAHERLLESRCLRQSVEPYAELGGVVPLHQIQVHCKKDPSQPYPPPEGD
jgi:hypothetical protein